MMRFIKYWLPVVLFSLVMLSFSSVPGKKIPSLFSGQAVLFHIVEYSVFAFLLSRAIKEYSPGHSSIVERLLLVLFLVLAFGVFDEFYQSAVPGRTPDLFDVMIDGIGGFLGGLFYR